jgi:hypothetical protein
MMRIVLTLNKKRFETGDHLSPLLFNLVVDVFSKMLMKAARHGLITDLLSITPKLHRVATSTCSVLMIHCFFLENNLENASTLKWLLVCFEQMSDMKINYDKSDPLTVGLDEDQANEFARLFCCKRCDFPIKYMGVPLHYNKLTRKDQQLVVDKIITMIAGWRGRLLSYAGRLILLKACLASIPIYLLSIIKFPKWAIKMMTSNGSFCVE